MKASSCELKPAALKSKDRGTKTCISSAIREHLTEPIFSSVSFLFFEMPHNLSMSLAGMIYQNHINSLESRMDLKIGHWVYKAQISHCYKVLEIFLSQIQMIKKIHKNLKKSNKSENNCQISIHGSSR
jgi:hypothetical protein